MLAKGKPVPIPDQVRDTLSLENALNARRNDIDAEQQIRAALEATVDDAANFQGESVVAEVSRRRRIIISAGERN